MTAKVLLLFLVLTVAYGSGFTWALRTAVPLRSHGDVRLDAREHFGRASQRLDHVGDRVGVQLAKVVEEVFDVFEEGSLRGLVLGKLLTEFVESVLAGDLAPGLATHRGDDVETALARVHGLMELARRSAG